MRVCLCVSDFVFLAGGLEVVFKIALILLGDHKELIKHCDSFESINDFLKTTLPLMSIIQMERVFNQVRKFGYWLMTSLRDSG